VLGGALLGLSACTADPDTSTTLTPTATSETSGDATDTATDTESGDGDGDSSGDGDGDSSGDGDGTGDGDGDGDGDTGPAFCGDGVVAGFESCDCGTDAECTLEELDGLGCSDILHEESGNNYDGGVLHCNLSCQFDFSGCFVCGDGVLEETEPCDGDQFGNSSCGSEGFLGGDIVCTDSCTLDTSGCTEATWFEDWESGAIDSGLWGGGGDAPWVIDDTEANGGSFSAHSGAIGDNMTSDLVLDMTWDAAGTVAFAHKQDTEGSIDRLEFFIDDVQQGQAFGSDPMWADHNYPVTAGTHRLTWRYYKDGSIATGLDRVWIDDVRSDGYPATAMCGDNFLSSSEICDGNQLGANSCASEGFLGGTLTCDGSCQLVTTGCTNPTWTEDWESGNMDSATWGGAGDLPWVIDSTEANGGTYSAHSGAIADNQTSDLFVDMVFAAPGTVAFWLRTDSDGSWSDRLEFYIDDVMQGSAWGGSVPWADNTFPVPMGTHRLMWRYAKDASFSSGLDRVWLDDLRSDGLVAVPTCGDNFLSSSEICDGTDVGTNTCEAEGFLGGTIACDGSCNLDTSGCAVANFTEDWETGDFTNAAWVQGGDSDWTIDNTQAEGGTYSIRSGVIGNSSTSDVSITLNFAGAGVMNFSRRLNSAISDELRFLIDDVEQGAWYGVEDWTQESFPVTAGSHTFTWRYAKNAAGSTTQDRVWIDNILTDGTP
jgi:hypothetical protein